MIKKNIEKALDEYFANVSREEFIADLKNAGFTVYKDEETLVRHVKSSYSISCEAMKNLTIDVSMLKETLKVSDSFEYSYINYITYRLPDEYLISIDVDYLLDEDAA